MTCTRCQGLTVLDKLFDPIDDIQWVVATRCLNCGDLQESVLRQHRQQKPARQRIGRQPRQVHGVLLKRAS